MKFGMEMMRQLKEFMSCVNISKSYFFLISDTQFFPTKRSVDVVQVNDDAVAHARH
jgi:hypothetical protein